VPHPWLSAWLSRGIGSAKPVQGNKDYRPVMDVEVRHSDIEGSGVFASRSFTAGETIRVVNIVREITADAPLRPDQDEHVEHCNWHHPEGAVVLYGVPDRHYNHSCDPNAWERFVDDRPEIVARRLISQGEEITIDYMINNGGGAPWPCNCGASRCRGTTSVSFFALPPDVQREYIPLLADWFVARYSRELSDLEKRPTG